MNVFSSISISLLLTLVFLLDLTAVTDAVFCQAVDGVYHERPNDPGAQETPASISATYYYDLETSADLAVELLHPQDVATTLQHRLADALVFTLFHDCRVDPTDKLAEVNLLEIDVQVVSLADCNAYEVLVKAVGDSAVGDVEQVLAKQRLENAVRLTLTQHHVARFSVAPGAILTLRLPSKVVYSQPDKEQPETPPSTPTTTTTRSPIVAVVGGCVAVLVAVLAIVHQRHNSSPSQPHRHHHVHFTLPGEEDDVELACSSSGSTTKATSKLLVHACDPTETDVTEMSTSSGGEHEEDW